MTHDVISRGKVLPPGEWTRSVCPAHICSSVRQFLMSHIWGTGPNQSQWPQKIGQWSKNWQ